MSHGNPKNGLKSPPRWRYFQTMTRAAFAVGGTFLSLCSHTQQNISLCDRSQANELAPNTVVLDGCCKIASQKLPKKIRRGIPERTK
jgi:hypothetical protein